MKRNILIITIILIFSLFFHSFYIYGDTFNKAVVVEGIKSVNMIYNTDKTTRKIDSRFITAEYVQEIYYVMNLLSYDNLGIEVLGRDLTILPPPKHIRDSAISTAEGLIEELVGESDRETVINIDNYLRKVVSYKDKVSNAHNSYGALINGYAVCEGYARAFKLLCDKVGIPALVIIGEADFGLAPQKLFGADLVVNNINYNHAWNIVYVDGEWYHFDTTWNDTLGESKYRFISDAEIRKDHKFDNKYLDEIIALLYGKGVDTYTGVKVNTMGYNIKESAFNLSDINSIEDIPVWFWYILIGLVFNIILFIVRKK